MSTIDQKTQARDAAITTARRWLSAQPLFLDTETTGLKGAVCEIAVVDYDGVVVFDSLINPMRPIEAEAQATHGITDTMVAGAPEFKSVWRRLRSILLGRVVVVYNADFDREALRISARDLGGKPIAPIHDDVVLVTKRDVMSRPLTLPDWHCAMRLYAHYYGERNNTGPEYKWQKLGAAYARECEPFDLIGNAHRAQADAQMCRLVLLAMAKQETEIEKQTRLDAEAAGAEINQEAASG